MNSFLFCGPMCPIETFIEVQPSILTEIYGSFCGLLRALKVFESRWEFLSELCYNKERLFSTSRNHSFV